MMSPIRRSLTFVAGLAALLVLPAKSGEASLIEYAFRGHIRTIQHVRRNTDPILDDWTHLLGPPVRVGDPFEITLTFEPREPHSVWVDPVYSPGRSEGMYAFPREDYTLGFRIGGHEFGETTSPGTLNLRVQDSPVVDPRGTNDSLHATIALDRVGEAPQQHFLSLHLGSGVGTLLDGVGWPTDLSIDDFPNSIFALVPSTLISDDVATEISGTIDAIEVTTVGVGPGSPTPANPSTPVPEPGMMTLFGGMTLAVMARRRLRRRSGG